MVEHSPQNPRMRGKKQNKKLPQPDGVACRPISLGRIVFVDVKEVTLAEDANGVGVGVGVGGR